MKHIVFLLVIAFGLVLSARAMAFTPPPMTAHVTDTAGKLTEPERIALDHKLEDYRLRTGNQIAVFLPASLDGDTIEEVSIATARAWHIGVKGRDEGVLLVIAPAERRARIEVGKGAEGAITDLQSNDILHNQIRPLLAPGFENYRMAVDVGTSAIMTELDKGGMAGTGTPTHRGAASPGSAAIGIVFLLLVFLVPIILFIVIIRAITSAFTSHGPGGSAGWASGGTWSSDSSWSSSSNDSSWSGGSGGGDSGFTGGGGDFGGGGSSDSF
jgi:uncharacterized protein